MLSSRVDDVARLLVGDVLVSETIKKNFVKMWRHDKNDVQCSFTLPVSTLSHNIRNKDPSVDYRKSISYEEYSRTRPTKKLQR